MKDALACNLKMDAMLGKSKSWFQENVVIDIKESASASIWKVIDYIDKHGLPPLYIIIDEYDNFANQLILSHKDHLYSEV